MLIYATGWDCNLFIWQLYNILLCDYTTIIHGPHLLPKKKKSFGLLPGFAIINSDFLMCISLIEHRTQHLYFPPLYTPAHALCYFPKNTSKACTLAGTQGSSTEHMKDLRPCGKAIWPYNRKRKKYQNGEKTMVTVAKISKSVSTLKKSTSVQWWEPWVWGKAK